LSIDDELVTTLAGPIGNFERGFAKCTERPIPDVRVLRNNAAHNRAAGVAGVLPWGRGRCGGRMTLLATIEDPAVIRRILTHLGLSVEAGEALPAARAAP